MLKGDGDGEDQGSHHLSLLVRCPNEDATGKPYRGCAGVLRMVKGAERTGLKRKVRLEVSEVV